MKNITPERREEWLSQLRHWAGDEGCCVTDTPHRAMTENEIRTLANSSLVTIGAHTVTHSRLSLLSVAEQREEITASKQQLETWLGRKISVFSYPYGKRGDFTGKTATLCRNAGFSKAAANFPGQAHTWTDQFRIPRLLVRDWPVDIFAEKLREFWTR
jgi:peptidoglycan/xylan/chitin deacetylase (PgdA/CDA1 family)